MNTPKSGKPAGKPVRRDGVDPVLRSRARRRALQAIYAWQISGGNAQTLLAQFAHEQAHEVADLAYFEALVHGVLDHRKELDAALAHYADWLTPGADVEQIPPGEGAIVRRGLRLLAVHRDASGDLHTRSAVCPVASSNSIVVRCNCADAIWLASARL